MTIDPIIMKDWKSPKNEKSEKQFSDYDLDIDITPRNQGLLTRNT